MFKELYVHRVVTKTHKEKHLEIICVICTGVETGLSDIAASTQKLEKQ